MVAVMLTHSRLIAHTAVNLRSDSTEQPRLFLPSPGYLVREWGEGSAELASPAVSIFLRTLELTIWCHRITPRHALQEKNN